MKILFSGAFLLRGRVLVIACTLLFVNLHVVVEVHVLRFCIVNEVGLLLLHIALSLLVIVWHLGLLDRRVVLLFPLSVLTFGLPSLLASLLHRVYFFFILVLIRAILVILDITPHLLVDLIIRAVSLIHLAVKVGLVVFGVRLILLFVALLLFVHHVAFKLVLHLFAFATLLIVLLFFLLLSLQPEQLLLIFNLVGHIFFALAFGHSRSCRGTIVVPILSFFWVTLRGFAETFFQNLGEHVQNDKQQLA